MKMIALILLLYFSSEVTGQVIIKPDTTSFFYKQERTIYQQKNGITDYHNYQKIVPNNNGSWTIYNHENHLRDYNNYTKIERINGILYIVEYKNNIPDYFNKKRIE